MNDPELPSRLSEQPLPKVRPQDQHFQLLIILLVILAAILSLGPASAAN